jgi:HlyD family secretion protein
VKETEPTNALARALRFIGVRRAAWLTAIALIIFIAFSQALRDQRVIVHQVTRSDVVQSIVASGRVESPLRVNIGSQIIGTVASVPVVEGDVVKAGQLLMLLEDGEAKASLAQAHAAVVQANTRLLQLREVGLPLALQVLRQAEVNLHNMYRQYERIRELEAQGFVGLAQLDDAQRTLDLAKSHLSAAQVQVKTNRSQGSDYLLAQAALEQANANVQIAIAKLSYTQIQAPVNGTLISHDVERGNVVQPGKTLMVLSPEDPMQLVVQIDEKNLAYIQYGQAAIGSADAYPNERFEATLTYINPSIDPQRGSVKVKFSVPNPPAYLKQDMTVSVDIEVAHRTNALVVPVEVVFDSTSNAPWVMKINDGRAQHQPVQLGVRGSGKVEIISGLQQGDQVISANTTTLIEGQRVHAVLNNSKLK